MYVSANGPPSAAAQHSIHAASPPPRPAQPAALADRRGSHRHPNPSTASVFQAPPELCERHVQLVVVAVAVVVHCLGKQRRFVLHLRRPCGRSRALHICPPPFAGASSSAPLRLRTTLPSPPPPPPPPPPFPRLPPLPPPPLPRRGPHCCAMRKVQGNLLFGLIFGTVELIYVSPHSTASQLRAVRRPEDLEFSQFSATSLFRRIRHCKARQLAVSHDKIHLLSMTSIFEMCSNEVQEIYNTNYIYFK